MDCSQCRVLVIFFYQLFGYSDGTHSLLRIQWGTSDVMLHLFKSDEEINLSASWMTIFWWTTIKKFNIKCWSIHMCFQYSNPIVLRWTGFWSTPDRTARTQEETAWLGFAVYLLDAAKRKLSSFLEVRPDRNFDLPFLQKMIQYATIYLRFILVHRTIICT